MRKIAILTALGSLLLAGCGERPESAAAFRAAFVKALSSADTNLAVEVVNGMELRVKSSSGHEFTTFLGVWGQP